MVRQPHKCPVCGKFEFPYEDSFESCEVCGWADDGFQVAYPDETGDNTITFNEAKKLYRETGRAYKLQGEI